MTTQSSDNQQARIDGALKQWQQGDCVLGEQWFVHRLEMKTPLTNEAIAAAKQDADLAETLVQGFVVVTQTCDIVRSCSNRPYVEVSPLVSVDTRELTGIKRGRRPRYAYIPGLEDKALVADLDRVMTVEKAVIITWTRITGCSTDKEVRDFAQALSRKRTRFAFPDDFNAFASKLQDRLQQKHDKKSEEGAALQALREVRVRAAPSWESDPIDIMFWFIRSENEPNFHGQTWHELLKKWLKLTPECGRFETVNGTVVTLDDITARDYIESDPFDLDHLSSRQPSQVL